MPDPLQTNDALPPLWSIGPPPQKATGRLAADAAALTTPKRYRQIIKLLEQHGPMTLFELASKLGKHAHQISGRITELKRDLVIEPTGDRRPNPATGCQAEVYRLRRGVDCA